MIPGYRRCKVIGYLCRSSRLSVSYVLASVILVVISAQSSANDPWHYKLGQLKSNQQANLCIEKQDVIRLAKIFEDHGARPGYAAIAQTNACSLRIASFTPIEIVTQVIIELDEIANYVVSFVEVQTIQGDVRYLITTRRVRSD